MKKIIKLYTERKIKNIKTAKNILDKLTASNKNTIKSGIRLHDKLVEKEEEQIQKVRKEKATQKIQNFLGEKIRKIRTEKEEKKKQHATLKIQNLLRKTILLM